MSFRQQFVKFTAVGALGTLAHYAVLIFMVELLNSPVLTATIYGSLAGAVINYFLNYYWTFNSKAKHWTTASKFFIIAFIGLLLNVQLMWIFTEVFEAWYLFSQIVATVIIFIFNFFCNRLLTFKQSI